MYKVIKRWLTTSHRVSKAGGFLTLQLALCLGGYGCASMGTPGGGLYDETPPVLKSSDPAEGGILVKKQKITMHFDENIKLNNAMDKLTVSPPQEKAPIILSNAKTLTIELGDSLKPNTTYSVDLGDAVQDNNEGNPLEGLSLLFSTGDHIDTLQISGYLLNAADLEPITGAFVGIYKVNDGEDTNDSLFTDKSFERAGKTDAYGRFKILGCAPGTYQMYALKDGNTNYRYDLATEDIAFKSSPLVLPQPETGSDTLVLFAFNEGKLNRYLDDCSRPDSIHIYVRFAARMDSLCSFSFLRADSSIAGEEVLIPELNPTLDTLCFWIKDSALYTSDTLEVALSYYFTDTTGLDVLRTDTLQLLKPIVHASESKESKTKDQKGKGKKRREKKEEESGNDSLPPITYMTLKQSYGQTLDIGAKPKFEVSAPLDSICLEGLHLQHKNDTLWEEMQFEWQKDSLRPRRYTLVALPHYNPTNEYRLVVDSAAMRDIYGNPIDQTTIVFKEKSPEDYAHLLFNIEGVNEPAYVELLDAKDKLVQRAQVVDQKAKFIHVPAGKYYARMVMDANQNGKFDTGDLFKRIQPEHVYYLNCELQLRANWTIQQTWNPYELPVTIQKPLAVKQNKPKEKKEKVSKNEEYLRKMGKIK